MLFNSIGFLVFFAVVLALYYAPIFQWRQKKMLLLLASYVFYGLWNPPLVILLWVSTIVDYTAGIKLSVEGMPKKRRKVWLLLSVFVNLGLLGFFKYGNFLLENFTLLVNTIGIDYEPQKMDIILPMGISFYTFQTMSYTIDMYYRRTHAAKTFLDFALYVTFFPQLVAGPIVRAQKLLTQFYDEHKADLQHFAWGAFLLTLGLFEKMVFADTLLAGVADNVYRQAEELHILDAWTGTLAFSGQIFFDFAGYSTCAIGIAMMLGFVLPDNFLYPYGAIGFSDFWRRWHISLSTWLRDYLYIPLGGNRHGIKKMYYALMMTMLLGGLWHGASWTFVMWGFLHGLYLVVEKALKNWHIVKWNYWTGMLMAFLTFTLVNITWVFFRAQDFESAWGVLQSMFFLHPEGKMVLEWEEIIRVLVFTLILFLTHYNMRHTTVKTVASRIPAWLFGLLWGIMIFFISLAQGVGEQFIYFQF